MSLPYVPSLRDSSPLIRRPHRLRGTGALRLRGFGEVSIRLDKNTQVRVDRLGETEFSFDGAAGGARRFPSRDSMVLLGVDGVLTLRGACVNACLRGRLIDVLVLGTFQVALNGAGRWEAVGRFRP